MNNEAVMAKKSAQSMPLAIGSIIDTIDTARVAVATTPTGRNWDEDRILHEHDMVNDDDDGSDDTDSTNDTENTDGNRGSSASAVLGLDGVRGTKSPDHATS